MGQRGWAGCGYQIRGASRGIRIGRQIRTPLAYRWGIVGLAGFQGYELEGSPRMFDSGVWSEAGMGPGGDTGVVIQEALIWFFLSSYNVSGVSLEFLLLLQKLHEKSDITAILEMRVLRLRKVK